MAFTIVSAWVDAEHLLDKDYIEDHTSRSIMRALFFIALGIDHPLHMLAGVLMFAALFDQTLNWFMKRPIWFLGDTAKWDKFWKKRKVLYITSKIIALLASIYLFVN